MKKVPNHPSRKLGRTSKARTLCGELGALPRRHRFLQEARPFPLQVDLRLTNHPRGRAQPSSTLHQQLHIMPVPVRVLHISAKRALRIVGRLGKITETGAQELIVTPGPKDLEGTHDQAERSDPVKTEEEEARLSPQTEIELPQAVIVKRITVTLLDIPAELLWKRVPKGQEGERTAGHWEGEGPERGRAE